MMHRAWTISSSACVAVVTLVASVASAREIHVSKAGSDSGSGSQSSPYLTINKAAQVAQPGDAVTVHAGTYREWVKPLRGGSGEEKRITYRAAPGEEVFIKGSQRITCWVKEGDGVWKVVLPNSFFGDYNPYAMNISGGWLHYGGWHHCGDVYLDGEAFYERKTLEAVKQQKHTWCCLADEKTTSVWANFGKANPKEQLAEINVRQSVFMPQQSGLKYITVDGFHLMHSAENWQPPGLEVQMGTIGPRMGKHWVIQNCHLTNARCVGIILGHAPGVDYGDIDAFGDHVIRNNVIRRCGEAGIAGQKGATRCVISGNFIEDTNYRREFGGWETAAIKFHQSVDTEIRGNLIRRVDRQSHAGFGIWMDWANQGTRITGNIIYDTETANIFLEMNHGPILVDNNLLIGKGIRSNSEGTVFAHNLFVDCGFSMVSDTKRASQYYEPHTRKEVERKHGIPQNDKWFNNIFIRRGLDGVGKAPGYASDFNVFLEGAKKSSFADQHSLVDPFVTGLDRKDRPLGVAIRFNMSDAPSRVKGPWVDGKLVGISPTVGQTIEDRFGKPVCVNTDIHGRNRAKAIAGPFADLRQGENTVNWPAIRQ